MKYISNTFESSDTGCTPLQAKEEANLQSKTQACFSTLLRIQNCTHGGVQNIAALHKVRSAETCSLQLQSLTSADIWRLG
jgi:hypothetical protein